MKDDARAAAAMTLRYQARRRNLPLYRRRNKRGLENGRSEIEALESSESDERAGFRDDGHSDLLDRVEPSLQLVTFELEIGDALSSKRSE